MDILAQNTSTDGNHLKPQKRLNVTLKKSDPVESAKTFCNQRHQRLVYWRGDFHTWTGTHYRPLSPDAVRAEVYSFLAAASVNVEVTVSDTTTYQRVPFCPNRSSVLEVVSALKCLEGKTFIFDELNAPAWLRGAENKPDPKNLVALENAVLDLKTGETLPHSSELFTLTALPFPFEREAECPNWERFVADMFPIEATRREFQKAVGYMVSSDRSQQKIFLMKGPPRSGKGTTIRVLTGLLGRDNVVSPKLAELREHFGRQQLIGRKAAFFPDERLDGKTSEIVAWLLSISGEDDVSIARKNKQNWTGRLDTKVWISTNVTPSFDDASAAIASRFIVFQTPKGHEDNPDAKLTETLLGECPGILNWAMEGLRMLAEDGLFKQPAEAQGVITRMQEMAAPVLRFTRDRMILGEGRSVELKSAYDAYGLWARDATHKPMSRTKFEDAMVDLPGVTVRWPGQKGHQVCTLFGIGLRRAGEQEDDTALEFDITNDDVASAKVVSIAARGNRQ